MNHQEPRVAPDKRDKLPRWGLRLLALMSATLVLDACGGRTLEAFWGYAGDGDDGGDDDNDGASVGGVSPTGGGGSSGVGASPAMGGGVTGGSPGAIGSGGWDGMTNTGGLWGSGGVPVDADDGMGGESSEDCEMPSCEALGGECKAERVDSACVRTCSFPSTISITKDSEIQILSDLGCEVLDTTLYLYGEELTSVSGLESIREVTGSLLLFRTMNISGLEGLAGLRRVGETFSISETTNITSLSGLASLTHIGTTLNFSSNVGLSDLSSLSNLAAEEINLYLFRNLVLKDLKGLEGIRSVKRCYIGENPSLENLSGLNNLTEVTTLLDIVTNPALVTIELPELRLVEESLTITEQTLSEVIRFPLLESVGDQLTISDSGITSVELPQLSSSPTIAISGNLELLTLGGLPSLQTIKLLMIEDNPKFPQCEADAIDARVGACSPCENNDLTGICN